MNRVSIGFSRPKTWKPLASLIMLIEGTKYSHVFVTWHCTEIDRRKIFEAVGSGIRILSNVNFKKHAEVIELYSFNITDIDLITIEQQAHDMTGRPYGYKALIGLGIMRLFNMVNRVLRLKGRQHNPFKDGDYSQICVEAAGMVLKNIYDLPYDFEDYGLPQVNKLAQSGNKASKEILDRINGAVSKKK